MKQGIASRVIQWRRAWLCLAFALGIHVTDEALTEFLPVYNGVVRAVRAQHSWVPLPTFTFPIWLGGLILGVILLLALTPIVSRGVRWIRVMFTRPGCGDVRECARPHPGLALLEQVRTWRLVLPVPAPRRDSARRNSVTSIASEGIERCPTRRFT